MDVKLIWQTLENALIYRWIDSPEGSRQRHTIQ
jgi:hypothetical protein